MFCIGDVTVRRSKIHRVGLFAKRDFKCGEVIVRWSGLHHTAKQFRLSDPRIKPYMARIKNEYFLMPKPVRFMNHSCMPNTRSRGIGVDVARRNITKGEEITSNYLLVELLRGGFVCNCGSELCVSWTGVKPPR